jgi:hypothetical protein
MVVNFCDQSKYIISVVLRASGCGDIFYEVKDDAEQAMIMVPTLKDDNNCFLKSCSVFLQASKINTYKLLVQFPTGSKSHQREEEREG